MAVAVVAWDSTSISRRVIDRLRAKESWAEILNDASDRFLIDSFADELAEYARENTFLTRERKWSLAKNLSSLVAGAKAYDYEAHRRIGATGYVEASAGKDTFSPEWNSYTTYSAGTLVRRNKIVYSAITGTNYNLPPESSPGNWLIVNTNWTQTIGLPKWTAFLSTTGLSYVSVASVTLTPSMNYAKIPVVQGTYRSATFTATGKINEEFFISSPNIDSIFYEVLVNAVVWNEYNRLVDAMPTDLAFETENEKDFSGVYFKFGDDMDGKKLAAGDSVLIRYVETDGSLGNVTAQNSITSLTSTVFDITGELVSMYATNVEAVAGGKDYETVEEIRVNAISYFHAGESLGFKDSLESYLARTFAFIGKCVVWGSYEKNVDAGLDPSAFIASEQNLIFISAITPGQSPIDILKNPDGTANVAYKQMILSDTSTKKGLTDLFTFSDVSFVPFRINSVLYATSAVPSLAGIRQDCEDLLQETFNIEKFSFKQALYSSDLLPTISSMVGVDHHASYIEAFNEESFSEGANPGTPYRCDTTLKLWPVRAGSVRVVLTNLVTGITTTVAIDNPVVADGGVGILVGQNGFTVHASTQMTRSSGDFRFYLTPYPGGGLDLAFQNYSLKVYYRPDNSEDLMPKVRNQILFLKEKNVSAVYA